MDQTQDSGRHETPAERADRNWSDLLQELRVSQTGTQLIAGFLMTLPFQERFADLDAFQRGWYLGLVALAALTIALTLTPVAIHRRVFGAQIKARLVQAGHIVTRVSLAAIALLLAGIVVLIFDVVVSRQAASIAGAAALAVLLALLLVLPALVARRL